MERTKNTSKCIYKIPVSKEKGKEKSRGQRQSITHEKDPKKVKIKKRKTATTSVNTKTVLSERKLTERRSLDKRKRKKGKKEKYLDINMDIAKRIVIIIKKIKKRKNNAETENMKAIKS